MKKAWIWFVPDPAVAAATGGWQPGSSIFRPQTPPQLCWNPDHTESEHTNIKQNSSCSTALIHMLLPTFLVDCRQLGVTQKQKPISNSCFAQKFQLIWHWRKVKIELLWWLSVTKGLLLCKWDSFLATLCLFNYFVLLKKGCGFGPHCLETKN